MTKEEIKQRAREIVLEDAEIRSRNFPDHVLLDAVLAFGEECFQAGVKSPKTCLEAMESGFAKAAQPKAPKDGGEELKTINNWGPSINIYQYDADTWAAMFYIGERKVGIRLKASSRIDADEKLFAAAKWVDFGYRAASPDAGLVEALEKISKLKLFTIIGDPDTCCTKEAFSDGAQTGYARAVELADEALKDYREGKK